MATNTELSSPHTLERRLHKIEGRSSAEVKVDARQARARVRCATTGAALLLAVTAVFAVEPALTVSDVAVSPTFFNPTIGQRTGISFSVSRAGSVDLEIVDRDGFTIRTMSLDARRPGPVSAVWDGRDAAGTIVADEAYSLRIGNATSDRGWVYDSLGSVDRTIQGLDTCTYARGEAVLSYTLPRPARVQVLAGQASEDPTTHARNGPVLKAVVDWLPRPAGSVIEQWNGLDESGSIYVPDLPHFAVSVATVALPDNAIIAVGNRNMTFHDYASSRRPPEALVARRESPPQRPADVSQSLPESATARLHIRQTNARYDQATRTFKVSAGPFEATVAVDPRRSAHLLNPHSELSVFVDETLVSQQPAATSPQRLAVDPGALPVGKHRVAFNWASGTGAVAVNALVLEIVDEVPRSKPITP